MSVNGSEIEIEVLHFFEFSSKRKRSSIVIRHENQIKMLIKGADNVILDRLSSEVNHPYRETTVNILKKFSVKGLRTLCYAIKIFPEDEWAGISAKLDEYSGSPDKEKLTKALAEEIEVGFSLLGCSAVEDRLQDEVPRCIHDFL